MSIKQVMKKEVSFLDEISLFYVIGWIEHLMPNSSP